MRATFISPAVKDIAPAGPGMSAEFSFAIPKIWLRSEWDPNCILGRPVVCGLKDEWSKCLLALTFSFDSPSWSSLGFVLESALVNKVDLCNQYGLSIAESEWPAKHLPQQISADCGELGVVPDAIITGLGIAIQQLPPCRPDLKGMLERHFSVSNHQLVGWKAASNPTSAQSCQELETGEVSLTPREFQRLLLNTAVYYNNSVLKHYRLTPAMAAAAVKPRPSDLLAWGMANTTGMTKAISLNEVRKHLFPQATALITSCGIRHRGVHFICDLALRERWFERARALGRYQIAIAYDPRFVDRIFLISPDHAAVTTCELTPADIRFSGLTWAEVDVWRKSQRNFTVTSD